LIERERNGSRETEKRRENHPFVRSILLILQQNVALDEMKWPIERKRGKRKWDEGKRREKKKNERRIAAL